VTDELILPPRRFTIVIDRREKPHNRLFAEGQASKDEDPIFAYELGTVKTGDYIIKEAPQLITVEKKAHGREFYTNVVHDRARMMKVFTRLREFKFRWIVFQQTYEEFCDPSTWTGVKDPQTAMKVAEGWLFALVDQGINFIFAGDQADRFVRRLMVKKYKEERKRIRDELKAGRTA
jgi:hypothetical protein